MRNNLAFGKRVTFGPEVAGDEVHVEPQPHENAEHPVAKSHSYSDKVEQLSERSAHNGTNAVKTTLVNRMTPSMVSHPARLAKARGKGKSVVEPPQPPRRSLRQVKPLETLDNQSIKEPRITLMPP